MSTSIANNILLSKLSFLITSLAQYQIMIITMDNSNLEDLLKERAVEVMGFGSVTHDFKTGKYNN